MGFIQEEKPLGIAFTVMGKGFEFGDLDRLIINAVDRQKQDQS